MTTNDHKRPETTTNHQQTTTNDQQISINYHQTTTNGHPCTANQKADFWLLLPRSSNYKDHFDFEKHRQLVRGNCLLLSQYLCGVSRVGSTCYGRPNSQYSSCQKSIFLLIVFLDKENCFLVFQVPNFCSVGISHLHFLHNSASSQVAFQVLY